MNTAARAKLDDYINWSAAAFDHYHAARHSDALTNMRKAGEACCKFLLYLKFDTKIEDRIRQKGYKELIDLLIEKNAAPRKAINWLETFQIYGNLATHDNKVDGQQSEYGYNALKLLTEWLFIEELKISIPPRLSFHIKPIHKEDELRKQIDLLKTELQSTQKQSKKIKEELEDTQEILKTKPASEQDLKRELETALEKVRQLESSNEKVKQLEEQLKSTLIEAQLIKERLEHKTIFENTPEPIVETIPVPESFFKKHRKKLILASASFFLILFACIYFFQKNKTDEPVSGNLKATSDTINVLVLPFALMQDNPNISFKIEEAIVNEFRAQAQEQHLTMNVLYQPVKDKPATTLKEAIEKGKQYNCEIVYYGEVYEKGNSDSVNISLKYVFIRPEQYNYAEMKGESEIKSFTSLTDANFKKLKSETQFIVVFAFINKLQKEKKWKEMLALLDKTNLSVKWAKYNAGTIRVECYKQLGQHKTAQEEAEKNYQIYPDSAFAKVDLAFFYSKDSIGKPYRKSQILMEEALKQYPENTWYLVNYARLLYLYLGDTASGRKALEKAIKLQPTYDMAWEQMGELFNKVYNNPAKAMAYYEKAFQLNPKNIERLASMATIYYLRIYDNHKATLYAEKALQIDSTDLSSLAVLTLSQYSLKEYGKALYYGMKTLKLLNKDNEKNYSGVYTVLGFLNYQNGNTKDAINYFEKSIQLNNSESNDSYNALINIYSAENKHDQLLPILVTKYRQNPKNFNNCYNLGAMYMTPSIKKYYDPDKGIRYMLEAYRLNPKDAVVISKLFEYYYYGKKDTETALKYTLEAYKAEPGSYETNYSLGRLYFEMKEYVKARKYLEACIRIDAKKPEAYHDLALSYTFEPGYNLKTAFQIAKKGVEVFPTNGRSFFIMANILVLNNSYSEAKRCYEKAVLLNPSLRNPEIEKMFREKGF